MRDSRAYRSDLDGSAVTMSDGARLYYEILGSPDAPTLVFVNNYFSTASLWRGFTPRLAEKYRIVCYDLRNQGASSRAGHVEPADHVRDLTELIDRLDLGEVYLVGSSTATLVARDCALAAPERIRGMVAVGPMFNPLGGRRRRYVVRSWIRAVETGGVRGLFDTIYPLVHSDRTVEAGGAATYLAVRERFLATNTAEQSITNLRTALSFTDDWRTLAGIGCPTLLMAGEQDFYASRGALEELASIIPDARYTVIPMVGHLPYFEATDEFQRLVDEFVTDIENRSRTEGNRDAA